MPNSNQWTLQNVRLARHAPWVIVAATISFAMGPERAHAAATAAGTTISNTATATYTDPGGNPQTTPSNQVNVVVDELLDVTVTQANPGDVPVAPGSTNRVLAFTVTNTGNGSEAFRLTTNAALGGDQFNPTVTSIVIDNGDGVYDPLTDTVYTPGVNDPVLLQDASIRIFVLSTIPGSLADLDRGLVSLTARATTITGSNTPGTVYPGAGTGPSDAVVGLTTGTAVDQAAYVVQTASVTFTKSAVVLNQFGNPDPIPGAIITYTLVANVTGTGTLTNLTINDPVPVNTAYQSGTLTLQSSGLSDLADADAGEVASGNITVRLGTVSGGTTRTVTFKVKIN